MSAESAHPDHIGEYTIESRLGAGGMGTVYLGRHDETDELVAIKVLPASLAREEGFVRRFRREVDAMQSLKNRNIVEFLESGVEDDRHYYVMEYVEGETITNRLHRERRIPWREVVDIAIQICTALKSAHAAGIVHRDLKPSNLMIKRDGTVKLTDFGIAHVFAGTQLTQTGGIIGTAEFMSPEQAGGRRVTKQSDLYSLGAVVYVMLTGRPPFTGKSSQDVIRKHLHDLFDRPRTYVPDMPHWLDDLVCDLLEKKPEDRPADANVVLRSLESILRKVEYAAAESSTRTAVSTGDATSAATVIQDDTARGPGPATLMRDLVKAEVERSQRKSAVGRWLDNTWVLVGLLAVVVGFTVWMGIGRGTANEGDESEQAAERFLQRAQRERATGNPAAAERTLVALKRMIEETGRYEESLPEVESKLESVRRQLDNAEPDPLLEEALDRIAARIEAGEHAIASERLDDLATLYADDPRASDRIEQLRTRIDAEPEDPR